MEHNKAKVIITFSNRAYSHKWYKNLQKQSPVHFGILQAIKEIEDKDGGEIVKSDIFNRDPEVAKQINSNYFNIVPSKGQMLRHNGNGIRHAKFSPSKSIALVWLKIGESIYVTFDDHAPIRYHRAIRHLRDLRLGRRVSAKNPRNGGRFLRKFKAYWKHRHQKNWRSINLKDRFYE